MLEPWLSEGTLTLPLEASGVPVDGDVHSLKVNLWKPATSARRFQARRRRPGSP